MSRPDYTVHYQRFHDDSDPHAEKMAAALSQVLEGYLPEDRSAVILDVGCGFGFALRALRHRGYTNLQGLETSPTQAERCRRAGFPVEVTEDSLRWLKDRGQRFDFVLLLDVLEHVSVDRQIAFLEAIRHSLRPGGRLFLTTPNANSPLAARWRYIDHTHTSSFTEHSLHYILQNAGFTEIAIERNRGIGRMPRRLWNADMRKAWRRWFVRWCWLQVFKAELPWEKLDEISFELNLRALAGTRQSK